MFHLLSLFSRPVSQGGRRKLIYYLGNDLHLGPILVSFCVLNGQLKCIKVNGAKRAALLSCYANKKSSITPAIRKLIAIQRFDDGKVFVVLI